LRLHQVCCPSAAYPGLSKLPIVDLTCAPHKSKVTTFPLE